MVHAGSVAKINPLTPLHKVYVLSCGISTDSSIIDAANPIGNVLKFNFVDFEDINLHLHKNGAGELQVQTTVASVIQIDPQSHQTALLKECLDKTQNRIKLRQLAMVERMKLANQVTLSTIIENKNTLSKDMYYCFEGVVDRIENKLSLWYNACTKCSASVYKTTCNKCKEENVETNPSLQTSSTFRFLIPLNVKTKVDGKKLTAVAEAIEKINPPLEKGKKGLKNDTDVDGNLQKQSHQKKNKHRITHTSTNVEISSDEETLQTMKKKYVKKMSAPRNTKTKKLVEIKNEKP
ncbi:alcohol dehydrogenase [Striga asiatica]|uniref:Alcohol dehydrogenase n=1 Tax=Striga asiatica TaxID=4170 RepID=A0A5A7RGZ7_STRAF|nr:alcohol dehydrogenase [Striga asiatica]